MLEGVNVLYGRLSRRLVPRVLLQEFCCRGFIRQEFYQADPVWVKPRSWIDKSPVDESHSHLGGCGRPGGSFNADRIGSWLERCGNILGQENAAWFTHGAHFVRGFFPVDPNRDWAVPGHF